MQVYLAGGRNLQVIGHKITGHKTKACPKKPLCKAVRRFFRVLHAKYSKLPGGFREKKKNIPNAKKPVDRYRISPLCFIIIITLYREKAMVSEAMNIDTDGLLPLEMPALMPVSGMPDTEDSGAFPHPFFVFGDEDEDYEEDSFDDMEEDFDDDFEDEDDFDDDDDDEDGDFEDEDDDYDYDEDSDDDYDDE
jgi:hypothetical protein